MLRLDVAGIKSHSAFQGRYLGGVGEELPAGRWDAPWEVYEGLLEVVQWPCDEHTVAARYNPTLRIP